MKLEINYKKKTGKFTHVGIKQYATEQPIGQRIFIKTEIKNILGQMKMEIQDTKLKGCRKSSSKRENQSNKPLYSEARKI